MAHAVMDKLNFSDFEVGSSHLVKVTYIYDPKHFYVRTNTLSEEIELLETPGRQISVEELQRYDEVIYKSHIFHKYVRGLLFYIVDDMHCRMVALDYGCLEFNVPIRHIYRKKWNLPCPPLAVHCELFLCEPKAENFDKNAINAMKSFVEHTAKMTVISRHMNKFTVELRTAECPGGVAPLLAMLNYTRLAGPHNIINRFSNSITLNEPIKYVYKKLCAEHKLSVRIQSGENISNFYVAEIKDHRKYIKSKSNFGIYCEGQGNIEDMELAATEHRCCGVKFNNEYERAMLLKVTAPNCKALVKLVDLGIEIETSFSNVKAVTSQYYIVRPVTAIYCSTTEDQLRENSLSKFLNPGYQLMIKVVEFGNNVDVPHKVNIFPMEN